MGCPIFARRPVRRASPDRWQLPLPPSDIGIVWVGGRNALASVNDKYIYSGELRFPFPVDTRACPTLADWKSGCESARSRAVPVRFPVAQREVDHVRDPDGRGGERNGPANAPGPAAAGCAAG